RKKRPGSGRLKVWSFSEFRACPRGRGRPVDGQIAFNILAVRLPMVWGRSTRLAKVVLATGPSIVRATPVTTVTQARNRVAAARMMVLRMFVGLEWCESNGLPMASKLGPRAWSGCDLHHRTAHFFWPYGR